MTPLIDVDPLIDGTTLPASPMGKRVTKKSKVEFADKLKAWRVREGIMQTEAATRLGLPSVRTLQNWEIARVSPHGALRAMIEKQISHAPAKPAPSRRTRARRR